MKFWASILSIVLSVGQLSADPVEDALKQKILENNPPTWVLEQIEADLHHIQPSSLKKEALEKAMAEKSFGDLLLIRYQIKNGKLSIHSTTPWATHNWRQGQLTNALNDLASFCQGKYRLPDCDFIVCLQDYFQGKDFEAPIFVFSQKAAAPNEMLFPNTEILAKGEELKKDAQMGNAKYPWEKKTEMAYWRGATTGFLGTFTPENYLNYPRFKLVNLSIQNPDWVDARFHWLCQGADIFRDKISDYEGKGIGIPEHMQYKYQILVDGNGCSWARAYWQLFCNSVIIKHDSDWNEYYYRGLQPYVHYIPVAWDFSNLVETIKWAKEHDDQAREISQNAQSFASDNLQRADIFYYIYLLLNRYAEKQLQAG